MIYKFIGNNNWCDVIWLSRLSRASEVLCNLFQHTDRGHSVER